ncbi:LysR family transcriptional regulator [Methylobacillus gramineus]|uniref:LysR family transcriptional regulator n=1 Tax=Methylobacillus gramineus TaxID=755169 RepID=UPI001CFFC583|nr:LysR family transcriptional regulator [Methylobacillus gramineus]MCB5185706.1 LysR family transcriptional regulator [Methylobacillus gramineus]
MDTLKGVESFVKAVDEGSIAAGARRMGISAAAASQNIARLEQNLGTRLLARTTRSIALTESGQIYYQRVKQVVNDLEEAQAAVGELHGQPQGKLRIASSGAFGRHVLSPLIPVFAQRYPRVSIELILTDHNVDHVREEVDISIRFPQQLEPGLVARKIAQVPLRFCASPAYLDQYGVPHDPAQLREHQCLVFRLPYDGRLLGWVFVREGVRFEAELNPVIISNDIDSLAKLAVEGAGIARIGAFLADALIEQGKLLPLFLSNPDAEHSASADIEPLDFYACYRDRPSAGGKVRLFLDYLMENVPAAWRT